MAERLKSALEMREMSPPDLIRATGISRAGVYFLLDGTTKPDKVRAETVRKLCAALHLNRDWLLTGKGSPSGEGVSPSNRETESQSTGLDTAILHEVLTLLVFDEQTAGPYPLRPKAERIAELYARVAADGGELTKAHNIQFVNEVQSRARGNTSVATHPTTKRRATR